jgi:SAM-dependent methyltransferase
MTTPADDVSSRPDGLMELHLIDDLAFKETFYWWHRVRRENLFRLLEARAIPPARVLEIGCGTGANLRAGKERWTTGVGLDLEMRALAYCRDLDSIQADAMAPLPFADGTFDAVFMLDVLEHLADPAPLVGELGRVLTRGGLTVIMVPARPELWSYWDEMHGHQRRYTKPTLEAVFGEGWRLDALEYSFSWMYPFVWAFRRVMQGRRRSPAHSDFIEIPQPLNALQVLFGRFEGAMQRHLPAPFGSTLCGVWSRVGRP